MIHLNDWAKRHGVTPEALSELQQLFTQPTDLPHSMKNVESSWFLIQMVGSTVRQKNRP